MILHVFTGNVIPVSDSGILIHTTGNPDDHHLTHTPMLFLSETAGVSHSRFPKALTGVLFAYLLGVRNPRAPTGECDCGRRRDDGADHTTHNLNCSQSAAFKAGHDCIVDALARSAVTAGLPCTTKNVLPHKTSDKVGDVHFRLSNEWESEIVDVTMTVSTFHPDNAKSARTKGHEDKLKKHNLAYAAAGHTFVPFAVTTTCTMHDEAVRCLAIIARRKAQIQVAIQPSHLPFSMVVGRATTSLHAVIGTSIAKGVAMRLMGLDTIRHLGNPPTRGWFTQEDLLDRQGWMDSGSDDDDHVAGSSFTGDSNVYNFALGAGR